MSQVLEKSVITLDMVKMFALFHNVSLEDGSQFPGVVGTLGMWEKGMGELNANLVDAPSLREVFKPLRDAYFTAQNQPIPEYSNVNDPAFLTV